MYTNYLLSEDNLKHIYVHDLIMTTYQDLNIIIMIDEIESDRLTLSTNMINKFRLESTDLDITIVLHNRSNNQYAVVCLWNNGLLSYNINDKRKLFIKLYKSISVSHRDISTNILSKYNPKTVVINQYKRIIAIIIGHNESTLLYPLVDTISLSSISPDINVIEYTSVKIQLTKWKHILTIIESVDNISYIIIRRKKVISIILKNYIKIIVNISVDKIPKKLVTNPGIPRLIY